MKSRMKLSLALLTVGLGTWVMVQTSCVKPEDDELHPAGSAFSCKDGKLNQDEYKVDCGGTSCSPCQNLIKGVSVELDSTWIADSIKSKLPWSAQYVFLSYGGNGWIEIKAVDTFKAGDPYFKQLTFNIHEDFTKGVYEIAECATNEKFLYIPQSGGGTMFLEKGVITVTNYDKVNKLVSGEFEFISKPHATNKYRMGLYNGKFTDIPLEEPE